MIPTTANRYLFLFLILFSGFIISLFSSASVGASSLTINTSTIPQPTPTFDVQRLSKPTAQSTKTTQIDQGAELYWGICMACHGDRGQGLTDEWRDSYGTEDRNCWQSSCHGPDHPPEGFVIPKDKPIPAVAGPGKLARFMTAQQLYDYIFLTMPWWKPCSLTPEGAWAVSSYILRLNNSYPDHIPLSSVSASAIQVHRVQISRGSDLTGQILLISILSLLTVGVIVRYIRTANRFTTVNQYPQLERSAATRIVHHKNRPNFFHHLHPPTIPLPQARLRYTLGAGGLAILLSLVILVTGALEMFFYVPTPEEAAPSIQMITFLIPFGGLIRNLHYWSAQALVIVSVVHLLRVVFTSSFTPPRRFNYFLGLILLLLTIFLDFTGYILRWDQGIRWALVVGTNLINKIPAIGKGLYEFIIGDAEPGASTLLRFYSWHVFGLTLVMMIFVFWHIFRVRRDGGIAAPRPGQRDDTRRISRFTLFRREMLTILVSSTVLLIIASLVPAPLAAPMDTSDVLMDVRAPWFFLWVQQLLRFGDPFWMGVVIPLLVLIIFILLPYVFSTLPEEQKGRWFPKAGRTAHIIAGTIVIAWFVLTFLELFQSPR